MKRDKFMYINSLSKLDSRLSCQKLVPQFSVPCIHFYVSIDSLPVIIPLIIPTNQMQFLQYTCPCVEDMRWVLSLPSCWEAHPPETRYSLAARASSQWMASHKHRSRSVTSGVIQSDEHYHGRGRYGNEMK